MYNKEENKKKLMMTQGRRKKIQQGKKAFWGDDGRYEARYN